MTEREITTILQLSAKRGDALARHTNVMVSLDQQSVVDLSTLLSSVVVFGQAYATGVITGLASIMKDGGFAQASLSVQEVTVEQVVLWRSIASALGTLAFERRLINFDQLLDQAPAQQFLSPNERGILLGNALEQVLTAASNAGVSFDAFWNITAEVTTAVGRLAGLDLVLTTADFDVLRELWILLQGVPVVPSIPVLVEKVNSQQPAMATPRRLPKVLSVTIQQGDTVEALAMRIFGDAAKWTDLVEFNNLRPPYIAEIPGQFLGEMLGERVLAYPTVIGQKTVTLLDVDGVQVDQRLRVVWNRQEQVVTVAGVTQATGVVMTKEAWTRVFPTIATAQLYPATYDVPGKVLTTGDVMLVPTTELGVGSQLLTRDVSASSPARLYGTDIAVGVDGSLSLTNGDLTLAEGVPNLKQAIRHRFLVERGSLVYHPRYGTGIHQYLGHKNAPYFAFLAQVDVHQTLAEDPRLASVEDFAGEIQGDTLKLSVQVMSTSGEAFPPQDIRVPLA